MPTIEGYADTLEQAIAAANTFNLPSDIEAGELLIILYISVDPGKYFTVPTGWDGEQHSAQTNGTPGFVWKIAEGDEGSTVSLDFNTGTSAAGGVALRISGVDTEDPFNTDNFVIGNAGSAINPWVLAADTITGLNADSILLVSFGTDAANRTISANDADLTLISSVIGGNTNFTLHAQYEAAPGSGNAAYSVTMNDTRDYEHILLEITAGSPATLDNPSLTYDQYYSTFLSSGS